ncbi:MAG: 5-formaminoimidazole-4-carboxamide-1-(beta)-D-ribofuranosyl 5'-monophosphate synthetase [Thermoplasmata archaeon]|nr:MAG: 5-formaminoimidazole-4-carboxamide-1-(beta)-D-ribofuranosyl 5'-monophosphate synthetase [Thermoplasmata archaeon]
MIERDEVRKIAEEYEGEITIGIFGSHSAKEIGMAAKYFGFSTAIIVQRGREKLYTEYYRHLYDEIIKVDKFRDMLNEDVQEKLLKMHTIFIPNRSFAVYVGYDGIEETFKIPIYGNRFMLRAEERDYERGQYYLLKKAGIRIPKEFKSPDEIDRLCIVKVQQAKRPLERAFFYAVSPDDYYRQAEELIEKGVITEEGLKKARIEEYVLGARFNANFHAYALDDIFGRFDLVGFSDRRQVNLQGFLNLPAKDQLKINVPVKNEEIGHFGLTMRESVQPLVFNAAEKFLDVVEEEYPPKMIGPFSLQGAIAYDPIDEKTLEFVVFDVSPRVPGDPAIGATSPEMRSLSLKHGTKIEDPADLIMMELQKAIEEHRLSEVVT